MPYININSDAVVTYAAKLERMGRAAFPVVARKTLNLAAMDVKQVTMPEESDRAFHKRKPTFFPATSSVEFAKGLDIRDMRAIVGFVAPGNIKESGHATKDLEEQEEGGSIDKRAFIATDGGRGPGGNVKPDLLLSKIKSHIVDASKENGKNDQERFIKAAIKAGYPGGMVIGTGVNGNGNKALLQIIALHRSTRGQARGKFAERKEQQWKGGMIVKTKAIYSVKAKRQAHVKATHFMLKATEKSAKKMQEIFNQQAELYLNKMK